MIRVRYDGPVLDFHNHLGRDVDGKSQTPAELLAQMAGAGVSHAVAFPFHTGAPYAEANAEMAAHARRFPWLVAFGRVDPNAPTWREDLAEIRRLGLKGVKIHPKSDGIALDAIPAFWDALRDVALPLIFHSADREGVHVKRMVDVLPRLGDTPIVFGHAGLGATPLACKLAREHANVALELSINPQASIEHVLAAAGTERVLFGSDTPYVGMRAMRERVERIESVTQEDLRRIYWDNAQRLLGGVR